MLYAIAFAGGVLAIVSPCILPVLPFVLARADQPFRRSGLPLLIGMGLTFAVVGMLASVAGDWVGLWLDTANGSRLDHVIIEYAGADNGIVSNNCRPKMASDHAALIVEHVAVEFFVD